ncbi:DUF6300 family protein [Streptomyces sp. NPDC088788]|uniref:DUF6300 family protein n=1 Tax=Streptomyces sp. NPDC088788 TaxID=3365898 RepID=UPI00381293C7
MVPGPCLDKDDPPKRACSRCGTRLLLQWNGRLMTGVWMELCTTCDAHRPAARAFITWYADPDRDLTAVPRLFEAWETETMHAHGWARAPRPEVAPGTKPHLSLVPPTSGERTADEAPEAD